MPLVAPTRVAESVVYCTSCGWENLAEASFCSSCGTGIQDLRLPGTEARDPGIRADYAGFWRRLAAQTLDLAIYGIALWILVGSLERSGPLFLVLLLMESPLLFWWFYKAMRCRTLGRILLQIEVIDQSGGRVSFWRGLLRETFGKFVSIIFVFPLGLIRAARDSKKETWHDRIVGTYLDSEDQAWHDRIARTYVVRNMGRSTWTRL